MRTGKADADLLSQRALDGARFGEPRAKRDARPRNRFRSWLLLAERLHQVLRRQCRHGAERLSPRRSRPLMPTSPQNILTLKSAAEKADRIGGTSPPRFGGRGRKERARSWAAGWHAFGSVRRPLPAPSGRRRPRAARPDEGMAPGEPVETSVLARTQRRATDRGPLIRRCAPPSPGGRRAAQRGGR